MVKMIEEIQILMMGKCLVKMAFRVDKMSFSDEDIITKMLKTFF